MTLVELLLFIFHIGSSTYQDLFWVSRLNSATYIFQKQVNWNYLRWRRYCVRMRSINPKSRVSVSSPEKKRTTKNEVWMPPDYLRRSERREYECARAFRSRSAKGVGQARASRRGLAYPTDWYYETGGRCGKQTVFKIARRLLWMYLKLVFRAVSRKSRPIPLLLKAR